MEKMYDENFYYFYLEDNKIRYLLDEENNFWFVGKDIATLLCYKNTKVALKQHCKNKQLYSYDKGKSITLIDKNDLKEICKSRNSLNTYKEINIIIKDIKKEFGIQTEKEISYELLEGNTGRQITAQYYPFENQEFGTLRTIINKNNEPYFIAKDIAKILGYKDTKDAIKRYCKRRELFSFYIEGKGEVKLNIIPESDLYRLIFKSNMPIAEKFTDWVVEEVIPSIRKYGAYITDEKIKQIEEDPEELHNLINQLREEKGKYREYYLKAKEFSYKLMEEVKKCYETIDDYVEIIEEKDNIIDTFINDNDNKEYSIEEYTKILMSDYNVTIGRTQCFNILRQLGYIEKDTRFPYQKYIKNGYFTVRNVRNKSNGKCIAQTFITPLGISKITNKVIHYIIYLEDN